MRIVALTLGAATLGAISAVAGAAAYDWEAASAFYYAPVPRWTFNPERDIDFSDDVCPAIRRECPQFQADEFEMSFAYDELYDARGTMIGVRLLKGSGCLPLDESIVLGQREFRTKFHKEGQSDIDDVVLELGTGVDPARVRIVKRTDNLQFSGNCP